uniref:carnitine O-palmitoyltransferase n=1 Tax=Aceria tosichella TaxID=561515 RepID=A0A6G1SAI3_9ACAR
MAEAHQAVAFTFTYHQDHTYDISINLDALHLIWLSVVRSWKKRVARFFTHCKNGFFPSSTYFLFAIYAIIVGLRLYYNFDTFGIMQALELYPPIRNYEQPLTRTLLACFVYSIAIWLIKATFMRYYLKFLLMYKGWMYESRSTGGYSLVSKLWLINLKLLYSLSQEPQLYSYQSSLPRLPLPALSDTIERYLRSIKPLCTSDQHYEDVKKKAHEFKNGIGKKLQLYLHLKSWMSTNYVSDWWEEYVYLRARSPLMVNSNYYGIDAILVCPTDRQTSRAANLIYSSIIFRRQIDRQELKPLMIQGIVPLCSAQYERIFNTCRVPGVETDKIVHLNDSSHVAVLHLGRFYKLTFHHKGRLLQPKQIEYLLDKIVNDKDDPMDGEEYIPALTALDRASWAKIRESKLMSDPINKKSLKTIESAAFIVVLEDDDFEFDPNDHTKLDRYGQLLLHGKGHDRWYDKSLNLIVSRTGRCGFNVEHAFADAPVLAHYWECTLGYDYCHLGYDDYGRCTKGPDDFNSIGGVQRLKWRISDELHTNLLDAQKNAVKILSDVDLRLLKHDSYGKGFIKRLKVSPDAYIQMALQLAYYRDVKHLSLTYEASMTRLYREGRTETVRPVTIESADWVYSMSDPSKTVQERLKLLKIACERHTLGIQDAMCGKGVDRHLFCLYIISRYLELENDFLKEVLSEPWKLSTSQTPHNQANILDPKRFPKHISCGGGFGPVADDGYGVSYMIAGEDLLFFHVSSKKSSKETDSSRFANNISDALRDMKLMFEEAQRK